MKNHLLNIVHQFNYTTTIFGIVVLLYASTAFCATRRPEADKGPTEVKLTVFVIDIDDVSDVNQSFAANVFYLLRWTDPRLAHTNAISKVMDLNDAWNPNIQLLNQQKIWNTLPDIVVVTPDGEVVYRQRVWGNFSQPLKLRDFPFDKQTFKIQFISIGYHKNEIKIISDPIHPSGLAEKFSVADWKILGWKKEPLDYITEPGQPLPTASQISIHAKRESNYFITTIIIPLVLIVMMSWAVFWIDPKQTGTQMSVAMTSMLTLIAFRFAVVSSLPNISYLTRLDFFLLAATILVFTSLIEVVITSVMAVTNKLGLARIFDKWSRIIFPLVFVVVTFATLLL